MPKKKPAKAANKRVAKKPGRKPAREAARKTAKGSADKSAKKTAGKSTKAAAKTNAKKATRKPAKSVSGKATKPRRMVAYRPTKIDAPKTPQLSVVMVTKDCKKSAIRALEALAADGYSSVLSSSRGRREVIVVDSGSRDGTAKAVTKNFPDVTLINRPDDVGFARAANLGLEITRGDFVLLLNPDVLVPKQAIKEMIGYLEATPYAAAVSPKLEGKGDPSTAACRAFPTLKREFISQWQPLAEQLGIEETGFAAPTSASAVDGISCACMLIRANALRQIGVLDEQYLAAFAELDWCRRADKAGWEIHYDPRLSAKQLTSPAPGESPEARWSYFRKHHGHVTATLVEAIHVLRTAVDSARRSNVIQSIKQVERFRDRRPSDSSLDR